MPYIYRMGTNPSPLCLLKKYGSSKAMEGKPPFYSLSLVMESRGENVLSIQNYINGHQT